MRRREPPLHPHRPRHRPLRPLWQRLSAYRLAMHEWTSQGLTTLEWVWERHHVHLENLDSEQYRRKRQWKAQGPQHRGRRQRKALKAALRRWDLHELRRLVRQRRRDRDGWLPF